MVDFWLLSGIEWLVHSTHNAAPPVLPSGKTDDLENSQALLALPGFKGLSVFRKVAIIYWVWS